MQNTKTPLNPLRKFGVGGGGGGGGVGGAGECQRIKVMRSRVYPNGHLPTIKAVRSRSSLYRDDLPTIKLQL